MQAVLRQTTFHSASRAAFSTQARVHPNILPFLQTRRSAARWATPIVALVAAGFAVNKYREAAIARQIAMAAEAERRAHESRELASKLLDAYGDGSSLESLENAVAVYESQNRS